MTFFINLTVGNDTIYKSAEKCSFDLNKFYKNLKRHE